MSRIALSGNLSGTGTFTIASPNSNSDRTLTLPDNSGTVQTELTNGFGFRNRLINSDMRIDQRNAGASVTPTNGQYLVDRFYAVLTQASKFSAQQNAGAVTPPTGFSNYQGVTSLSAYSILTGDAFAIRQSIEGFNVSDLGWGTASAQAVTISFRVRSSLTGSFGGNISNSAFNRSYPFSYSISAANTWEQKTVTIPGDTTGTWLTTNATGISLTFGLGYGASLSGTAGVWNAGTAFMPTGSVSVVATSGATFYITGVQLEAGSVATPFERRPIGTELALCQRYFQAVVINTYSYAGNTFGASDARTTIPLLVSMRTQPTGIAITGTVQFCTPGGTGVGSVVFNNATVDQVSIASSGASTFASSGGSSALRGTGTVQVSTEL
jgi:hypothetical protein